MYFDAYTLSLEVVSQALLIIDTLARRPNRSSYPLQCLAYGPLLQNENPCAMDKMGIILIMIV